MFFSEWRERGDASLRWPIDNAMKKLNYFSGKAEKMEKQGINFRGSCLACGGEFQYAKSGVGRIPRFCSDVCRATARRGYQKKSRSKNGEAWKRNKLVSKKCVMCNGAYETYRVATVTCGPECTNRLAQKTRTAAAVERRKRICEHCGSEFVEGSRSASQRAAGKYQRFCSRRCRGAASRKAIHEIQQQEQT